MTRPGEKKSAKQTVQHPRKQAQGAGGLPDDCPRAPPTPQGSSAGGGAASPQAAKMDTAKEEGGFRPRWPTAHGLLRWPFLLIACSVIIVVLVLYFTIRALIHATEWLFVPTAARRARRSLEHAASAEEYERAAGTLDEANELNAWKAMPSSRFYASQILASAVEELVEARRSGDRSRLLQVLQRCLREANFAGHLNEALYASSFVGTKHLVEDYCDAIVDALDLLRDDIQELEGTEGGADAAALLAEARRFVEFAVCTFGRSALCLSGGGGMAFQHFGVLEELLRKGLLPKIISGTSGGAAVASYVCCRTDDELLGKVPVDPRGKRYPLKLDPDQIQPTVTLWAGTWLERLRHYFTQGCMFPREPIERWAEIWSLGETTFLEAYLRTGRVLNITCSTVGGEGSEQVPLLLNYQTHPHVLVASAVICSGSMPSLLNPSKLLERCPQTGVIRAHCKRETCYADGSIDFDIPSITLAQAFGVRYTIACQVNPHVIPFNFHHHGEAGQPISWRNFRGRWRGGFVLCALELILKESFRTSWKIMGLLELLPQYCGAKWDLFFAQVYEGSVTLSNDRGYIWKALHALDNPSGDDFRYWWREGQHMAWQKMPLLEKRLRPERALFQLEAATDAGGHAAPPLAAAALPLLPSSASAASPTAAPAAGARRAPAVLTPTGLSVQRRRSVIH
mmetsp:Transcript_1714/g.6697  ORF Transcript_1714/g.6697 Transcript_1714/m.6697 type:complete len:682 (-) Transcript_1714:33-2078(-)